VRYEVILVPIGIDSKSQLIIGFSVRLFSYKLRLILVLLVNELISISAINGKPKIVPICCNLFSCCVLAIRLSNFLAIADENNALLQNCSLAKVA